MKTTNPHDSTLAPQSDCGRLGDRGTPIALPLPIAAHFLDSAAANVHNNPGVTGQGNGRGWAG
jgi:hypothetical protein